MPDFRPFKVQFRSWRIYRYSAFFKEFRRLFSFIVPDAFKQKDYLVVIGDSTVLLHPLYHLCELHSCGFIIGSLTGIYRRICLFFACVYLFRITVFSPIEFSLVFGICHPVVIQVYNSFFRAIVFFELYHPAFVFSEMLRKFENILYSRPSEAVQPLVIVTDHADISVLSAYSQYQLFLYMIRILIFIDHYISDFFSYGCGNIAVLHHSPSVRLDS